MNSPIRSGSSFNPVVADNHSAVTHKPRDQRGASFARSARPLRVLLGRLGQMGVELPTGMAHAFRQAGMEVVMAGAGLTPEMVCAAAIQEDVDIIAMSALDDENSQAIKRIPALLHLAGATDKLIMAGVSLPETEFAEVKELGFGRIFPLEVDFAEVIGYIEEWRNNRLHMRRDA